MARQDERAAGNYLFSLAVQHHQAGRLPQAEQLYRTVLAAEPNHIGALRYLGVLALQSSRPALAVDAIGSALALNEQMPECHYQIGYALYQLRRVDDAVAHYRRAIALAANYVDAHLHLGSALAEQGKLAEAAA